jgi:predicted nicotinamide N-methyase
VHGNGALTAVRTSLSEQLAALRGVAVSELPASLLAVAVREVAGVHVLLPADWEALRHDEGAAGRPVPFWARPWPSGTALAEALAADPPPAGARVVELGCGLGLPSLAAALAGGRVLATDWAPAALDLLLDNAQRNGAGLETAVVDWTAPEGLLARAPFDVVLAADVLYERRNVPILAELMPRLGNEILLADPGRPPLEDFLTRTGVVWSRPPLFRLPAA